MSQVVENPWLQLRHFTHARIALGRAGDSLPTREVLALDLAHAQARDAVHAALDTDSVMEQLRLAGLDSLRAHSAAPDRETYLRRPDMGRRLDEASRRALVEHGSGHDADIVFVIADGLSAPAVQLQAASLLRLVCAGLTGWRIGPVVVAEQARVALGDEVGEVLGTQFVAVLIGERPGLSAQDSLGIYITYKPCVGRTDAERNCISNVRPGGLSRESAAQKICYLLNHARTLGLTGVQLKDGSDVHLLNSLPEREISS